MGDVVMIDSVSSAEARGLEAGEPYRVVEFNSLGNLVVVPLNAVGENQGHGSLRFRLVRRATADEVREAAKDRQALVDEVARLKDENQRLREAGDSPVFSPMVVRAARRARSLYLGEPVPDACRLRAQDWDVLAEAARDFLALHFDQFDELGVRTDTSALK